MAAQGQLADFASWRHAIHSCPETGFQERQTARFVADKLREFGLDEVVEQVGGTGVVGTLKRGNGGRAIALRAELDALHIQESGLHPYRSTVASKMHACGHDGHMAMLLGAAHKLAGEGGFDGRIRFVFQPAEEWGRGADAMLNDGFLERFPVDEIYAVHNWPGLAVGHIATRPGALMAAEDNFEIVVQGRGGHAARPHQCVDALVAAAAIVTALQTIVSRSLDPAETAVVSATELTTDGGRNILPGRVEIQGDCRSFSAAASAHIEGEMRRIATNVAAAHGCSASVSYERVFTPLVNDQTATESALAAAMTLLEPGQVDGNCRPVTASDDFARFLADIPGCMLFLGNGVDSPPLHNSRFDFNDDALACGIGFLVNLSRRRLAIGPR